MVQYTHHIPIKQDFEVIFRCGDVPLEVQIACPPSSIDYYLTLNGASDDQQLEHVVALTAELASSSVMMKKKIRA